MAGGSCWSIGYRRPVWYFLKLPLKGRVTRTFPSIDPPARNMDVMPFARAAIWDRKAKATLGVRQWLKCTAWSPMTSWNHHRLFVTSRLHSQRVITHLEVIAFSWWSHTYSLPLGSQRRQGSGTAVDLWGHSVSSLPGRFKTTLSPSLFGFLNCFQCCLCFLACKF